MRSFSLRIFDPPKQFETEEPSEPISLMGSPPIAALFATNGPPTEICRLYGYLMLLGQNLEFELRECLMSMQFALAIRGIKPRCTGNPEKAKFDRLIQMFAAQLNINHPPTKAFVDDLHRARKLRNHLAHGFLSPAECAYFITQGGQQAILHRLKLAEKIFFPVIMVVDRLSHAYARDYGVTDDFIKQRQKAWEAEQRQIENDLKDIFDDQDHSDGTAGN